MAFLYPFEGEFCGEIRTIYAVDVDNPEKHLGSNTTLSEQCPNCGEGHIYRVYDYRMEYEKDGYGIEVYDCKCPSCRNNFDLKIEFELDD